MSSTEASLPDLSSGPQRDRRNRRRATLWALIWAFSYLAVSLGIKVGRLPFGVTVAGVIGTGALGVAMVLAYRRFVQQTDELRRKVEVEALAVAFGVGVVGGLTYWLLAAAGAVPEDGFVYVVVGMILTHPVGILIGLRRYA